MEFSFGLYEFFFSFWLNTEVSVRLQSLQLRT